MYNSTHSKYWIFRVYNQESFLRLEAAKAKSRQARHFLLLLLVKMRLSYFKMGPIRAFIPTNYTENKSFRISSWGLRYDAVHRVLQ